MMKPESEYNLFDDLKKNVDMTKFYDWKITGGRLKTIKVNTKKFETFSSYNDETIELIKWLIPHETSKKANKQMTSLKIAELVFGNREKDGQQKLLKASEGLVDSHFTGWDGKHYPCIYVLSNDNVKEWFKHENRD